MMWQQSLKILTILSVISFVSAQELVELLPNYSGIFLGILFLVLFAIGIVLFVKSKEIRLKSLKTSILLPLIWIAIGVLWWILDFVSILDFGTYIFISFSLFIWPITIITSLILSIISLDKMEENKNIAIGSLSLIIIYLVITIGIYFLGDLSM